MIHPFDLSSLRARLGALGASRALPESASRRAAVAVMLREARPGAGADVLLIRRAEHPLDPWSGHMAFPGGRMDPEDRDLVETAMREAREEVGVDLAESATLLARLPDVQAVAKSKRVDMVIAPYVFAAHAPDVTLTPNGEVAETVWMPLEYLASGEGVGSLRHEFEGVVYDLPCLRYQGRMIWGLTHQMLQALFAVAR